MALVDPHDDVIAPSRLLGLLYAWSGFAVMWAFWLCFVVFLANPRWAAEAWPLPTIDQGGWVQHPLAAAGIDVTLIALFGLQHSLMARPWFKQHVFGNLPAAFERCTYVHAANLALFALIVLWQPIPMTVWDIPAPLRQVLWTAFAVGWLILLLGALSFGLFELLGVKQMHAWCHGRPAPSFRLKTGLLYRVLPHPMYVGVLLAMWSTPRMTVGHMLLAAGMTIYVLIAMRYEERDLVQQFGHAYAHWRRGN